MEETVFRITWFGTASLGIEAGDTRLLIDPFIPLPGSRTPAFTDRYRTFDTILVTHGHIDHIASLPAIVKGREDRVTICCTQTPAKTLAGMGLPQRMLRQVSPGDTLTFGELTAQTLQGQHIRFDRQLVLRTLFSPRMLRHMRNLPALLTGTRRCPEAGETLAWHLQRHGLRILILGSLGIDQQTIYPDQPDLLVLPFQGSSDLLSHALPIVRQFRPRAVLLDHFDDPFPPISNIVPTDAFVRQMSSEFPDVPVRVPDWGQAILLMRRADGTVDIR